MLITNYPPPEKTASADRRGTNYEWLNDLRYFKVDNVKVRFTL